MTLLPERLANYRKDNWLLRQLSNPREKQKCRDELAHFFRNGNDSEVLKVGKNLIHCLAEPGLDSENSEFLAALLTKKMSLFTKNLLATLQPGKKRQKERERRRDIVKQMLLKRARQDAKFVSEITYGLNFENPEIVVELLQEKEFQTPQARAELVRCMQDTKKQLAAGELLTSEAHAHPDNVLGLVAQLHNPYTHGPAADVLRHPAYLETPAIRTRLIHTLVHALGDRREGTKEGALKFLNTVKHREDVQKELEIILRNDELQMKGKTKPLDNAILIQLARLYSA